MGTSMSCNSSITDIDDASEVLGHPQSSSLTPRDYPNELFQCGCCQMEISKDMDVNSQDDREMKSMKTITTYRSKYLQEIGSDNGDGFDFGLNMVHESSPPFLGASFWMPIHDSEHYDDEKQDQNQDGGEKANGTDGHLNMVSNTVGTIGYVKIDVFDESVLTEQSLNSSIESKIHTSCITASTRDFESPTSTPRDNLQSTPQLRSTPNFIMQTTARTISTPCINPQPGLQPVKQEPHELSSVSTASVVSSAPSIAAKAGTARRLFGNRDDLLYSKDMNPATDPILITCDDVCDHEEDNIKSLLKITTPTRKTKSQTSTSKSVSPCANSRHSSNSKGGSIILCNGILLKRQIVSPDTTPITISPTSTTTTTTKQKRQQISSNNTIYSANTIRTSDTVDLPDGISIRKDDATIKHVNTLPSFREGCPIRLRVTESYAGYSSGNLNAAGNETDSQNDMDVSTIMNDVSNNDSLNVSGISLLSHEEQQDFFSYDPYFSSGQYLIEQQETGNGYGNELRVTMGDQYMTLQDKDDVVWAVTRSRHSHCPSTVIYSPKERYPGQNPSSHRPISQQYGKGYNCNNYRYNDSDGAVELYPWALVKKEGRGINHDVAIHLVSEPNEIISNDSIGRVARGNRQSLIGGLFDSRASFRSRQGFDEKEARSCTIMHRVEVEDNSIVEDENDKILKEKEIPCCIINRDPKNRDVVDMTIAPGIDPLLIICYSAVHSKMDVEPKLCEQ